MLNPRLNLSTALLATTALAGFSVFAQAQGADLSSANDAAGTFIAPVTLAQASATAGTAVVPTVGRSSKVRIVGAGASNLATASAATPPIFFPFYFDASGSFLFAQAGTQDSTAAGVDVALTISGNTNAATVAFVAVADGTNDTIGSTSSKTVGVVTNIKAGTAGGARVTQVAFTVQGLSLSTASFSTALADADQTAIAASIKANFPGSRIPIVNYNGLSITRANKPADAAGTVSVSVFADLPFDPSVIPDATAVKNDLRLSTSGGAETAGGVFIKGASTDTTNGGFLTVTATSGTAFAEILTTAAAKGPATPVIKDLAGNGFAIPTSATIVQFQKPAYDTTTAKAIGTALSVDSSANRATLHSAAGLASTVAAAISGNLRFVEDLAGGAICDPTDLVVVPSNLTVTAFACATGGRTATFTLTDLTPTAGELWTVNSTTGAMSYAGTPVTVQAVFSSTSPLSTAAPGSQAFASSADNLAATGVFVGMAETPQLATRDNDVDGLVDGATADFRQSIGTPAAADFSMKTAFGGTARDISFNATKIGNTKAALTFTAATAVDWSENGTAGEAADAALYNTTNFNTGVVGATVKYTTALAANRTLKYGNVFNGTTGELGIVATTGVSFAAFPTLHTDGASPIINSASWAKAEVLGSTVAAGASAPATSGTLTINGSETLLLGVTNPNDFLFNGAPLNLLAANGGITAAQVFSLSTPTGGIANSVLSITNVPDVTGTKITIGSAPGVNDNATAGVPAAAANNILATTGNIVVGTANQANQAPVLVEAIAVRDGTGIRTNISKILVRYSKPVQLAAANFTGANTAAGVAKDGLFKVLTDAGLAVNVPASGVNLAGAGTSGQIILTLPSPGLPAATATVTVEYDGQGGNNILTSTEASGAQAAFDTGSFVGVNDGDTISAKVPANTTKLFVGEYSGQVLKGRDGAAPKAGSVVQANLVGITRDFLSGPTTNVTLNCGCDSGVTTVPVIVSSSGQDTIRAARRAGQQSVLMSLALSFGTGDTGGGGSAASTKLVSTSLNPPLGPNVAGSAARAVNLNLQNGNITQVGGAGSVINGNLDVVRVLDLLHSSSDTVFRVIDDVNTAGNFRFTIGTDETPEGAFLVIAVKEPDNANWLQTTSGDPAAKNFVSFSANNVSAGPSTIQSIAGFNLQNMRLSRVATGANTWRLIPILGEPDRSTTVGPWAISGFFVTVNQLTGSPVSIIDDIGSIGIGGADLDEVFGMEGNAITSYIELTNQQNIQKQGAVVTTLTNKDMVGGRAWAHRQTVGGQGATTRNLHYLVKASDPTARTLPAGWSLITAAASGALPGSLAATVLVVLEVDSSNQARTFFRNATDNTLTSLGAGTPYFIFTSAAVSAFSFKP
ncbi:MAG: hypothetical protein HY246_04350 [Proteobacteria bacterium]|nr:hypothetical protein [Pseudomonadota bacterium]